jgi:hypothetical protein
MTQEPPQSWPPGLGQPNPWAPPHRVDPLSGLPIDPPPPDPTASMPYPPVPDPTAPYPPPYTEATPHPGQMPYMAPYPAQQPGYHYPPYAQPYGWQVHRPTNGMAIASMVLGILWVYWLGSILALIFGYIARKQIRERGEGGDGMAIAGLVLGWIGVGTLVLMFVLIGVGAFSSR